jgi:hypothetical protein
MPFVGALEVEIVAGAGDLGELRPGISASCGRGQASAHLGHPWSRSG